MEMEEMTAPVMQVTRVPSLLMKTAAKGAESMMTPLRMLPGEEKVDMRRISSDLTYEGH